MSIKHREQDFITAAEQTLWQDFPFTAKEMGIDKTGYISLHLMIGLTALRNYVGKPIIIHEAYATSGHTENSYHYRGMAADFHIKDMTLLEQYLLAERVPQFTAIGLYPHWVNPGLHCDVRPIAQGMLAPRWVRNTAGVYVGLDLAWVSFALDAWEELMEEAK